MNPLAFPLLAALAAGPLLQDGDRIVFLGDSITVQHTYSRYVEELALLREPGLSLTFVNAGIGGNTAGDGLARLDRDVLAQKPTVVIVNFGMNDASYPAGSDGAAFEKNMGAILDRLAAAGVRLVVWADTSPFDVEGLYPQARDRKRERRIEELVSWVHAEGARRKLVVVGWHQPLLDAMKSWKAAGHPERLMADRIHPGPLAHAVMASALVKALGFDASAATLAGRVRDGGVELRCGADSKTTSAWDGQDTVTLDLAGCPAPVPFVVSKKDADDLGNPNVAALRKLVLRIEGLGSERRYQLRLDGFDAGVFSSGELRRGVDLMASAVPRPPPSSDVRPPLAQCGAATGNPFVNDFDCLFDLLYEKDQLRIAMRPDKTRALPDFVPDFLEQFHSTQRAWIAAVEDEISTRAQVMRLSPHVLTISVVPVAGR